MKPKMIVLCLIIIFSVFFHYLLKHQIIQTNRENVKLEKELISEKTIYKDLTSDYNHLQAYSRIVSIAKNELGMIIPANDPEKIQVVQKTTVRNRTVSRLLDVITPTAEAVIN